MEYLIKKSLSKKIKIEVNRTKKSPKTEPLVKN
jgi:hypothetical protein